MLLPKPSSWDFIILSSNQIKWLMRSTVIYWRKNAKRIGGLRFSDLKGVLDRSLESTSGTDDIKYQLFRSI